MYENFYSLRAKPFQLSPDPSFFYGSSVHKRVLAYLRYGINQGEGFVVVTGDVGTGKTTLIRTLLAELSRDTNYVLGQLVTTQLRPEEMLAMVASAFGISHEGLSKSALLRRIEAFLIRKAHDNKRVLLIVDEAQNIPLESLEELRMLSNYQVGSRPLLQSCLLGQAEFREVLQSERSEQLRQRVIASHHLGPLDPAETKGYIEHRLKQAGWQQDPEFTPEAFSAVYEYTNGVPRRINSLCDRVLLFGYLEELHRIDEAEIRQVSDELHKEVAYLENDERKAGPGTEKQVAVSVSGQEQDRLAALERRVSELEQIIMHARALVRGLLPDAGRPPMKSVDRKND